MQHAKNFANSSIKFLKRSKETLLIIIIVAIITLCTSTIVSIWLDVHSNFYFPSVGNIRTIGVKAYWDQEHANETTEIQWGTLYPGSTNNATLYLRSTSNYEATLKLQTGNWAFQNSNNTTVSGPNNTTSYMNLTWNYNDAPITPGEIVPVTLTLQVNDSSSFIEFLIQNNVNRFSFDINIQAQET
jgi:flagellar basal body-associated protein FliL